MPRSDVTDSDPVTEGGPKLLSGGEALDRSLLGP